MVPSNGVIQIIDLFFKIPGTGEGLALNTCGEAPRRMIYTALHIFL